MWWCLLPLKPVLWPHLSISSLSPLSVPGKNWPPAVYSCFAGPDAILQTHTAPLSNPYGLLTECHPHKLYFLKVHWLMTKITCVNYLWCKTCLSAAVDCERIKTFPPQCCVERVRMHRKRGSADTKRILCVHMYTAGSTKLSQYCLRYARVHVHTNTGRWMLLLAL